ncbi:unnamed protein product [Amoebophrya sp. A120]|nr:unnamed protein product [Amoebophrya sp. A120]|eukprot:GSA120T00013327001.1
MLAVCFQQLLLFYTLELRKPNKVENGANTTTTKASLPRWQLIPVRKILFPQIGIPINPSSRPPIPVFNRGDEDDGADHVDLDKNRAAVGRHDDDSQDVLHAGEVMSSSQQLLPPNWVSISLYNSSTFFALDENLRGYHFQLKNKQSVGLQNRNSTSGGNTINAAGTTLVLDSGTTYPRSSTMLTTRASTMATPRASVLPERVLDHQHPQHPRASSTTTHQQLRRDSVVSAAPSMISSTGGGGGYFGQQHLELQHIEDPDDDMFLPEESFEQYFVLLHTESYDYGHEEQAVGARNNYNSGGPRAGGTSNIMPMSNGVSSSSSSRLIYHENTTIPQHIVENLLSTTGGVGGGGSNRGAPPAAASLPKKGTTSATSSADGDDDDDDDGGASDDDEDDNPDREQNLKGRLKKYDLDPDNQHHHPQMNKGAVGNTIRKKPIRSFHQSLCAMVALNHVPDISQEIITAMTPNTPATSEVPTSGSSAGTAGTTTSAQMNNVIHLGQTGSVDNSTSNTQRLQKTSSETSSATSSSARH